MDAINSEIESYNENSESDNSTYVDENSNSANKRDKDLMSLEKRLFGIMFVLENKDKYEFQKIQEGIISIVGQEEYDKILESINEGLEELIFAVENSFDKEIIKSESAELLKNLKIKQLNSRRKELLLELKKAEQGSDENLENDLLNEINRISKEIQENN